MGLDKKNEYVRALMREVSNKYYFSHALDKYKFLDSGVKVKWEQVEIDIIKELIKEKKGTPFSTNPKTLISQLAELKAKRTQELSPFLKDKFHKVSTYRIGRLV